jgi:hypothetical protein
MLWCGGRFGGVGCHDFSQRAHGGWQCRGGDRAESKQQTGLRRAGSEGAL